MTPDDVVDAITTRVLGMIANKGSIITYGTFVEVEANPLYSHIIIDQIPYRNIAKADHVGDLLAGNTLIVVAGGPVPLTIVGKL